MTINSLGRDGDMGRRIRANDWHDTDLGPRATWTASLRMLVDVMLDAKQPMHVAWGSERTLIYNDPYGIDRTSRE